MTSRRRACGGGALMLFIALVAAGCGAHKPGAVGGATPNAPQALPKVAPEAQAAFDEGLRVMRAGRRSYKEARPHFIKATQLDPRLFEAWHNLGILNAALGNLQDAGGAIDSFDRALAIQPASRKTVLAYGEALRRAREPKKAAALYERWLGADPTDADMRARYAQMLREAGALEAALEQARMLLANAGANSARAVFAYNSLGLTYYKMAKLDLAETALRKAVELDPQSAFVWNNLGLVAFERGHDQEAFLDFQRASELDPKYMQARLNKAVVYMDCGDYKRARHELERAVEIEPNDAEAQVALGVAARGDGKLEQARRAYQRALEIEPDYRPALYNLGLLYMDFDKDPVKARTYLTRFAEATAANDPKRKDAEARLAELR